MSLAFRVTQIFPRSATLNRLRSPRYKTEREQVLLLWSVFDPRHRLALADVRERVVGVDSNLVDSLVAVLMVDGLLGYDVDADGVTRVYLSNRGVNKVKKILESRMRRAS